MEIKTQISYIAPTGKKVTQVVIHVVKVPEMGIVGIGSVVTIN